MPVFSPDPNVYSNDFFTVVQFTIKEGDFSKLPNSIGISLKALIYIGG
ncbi:hypothetical protein SD77_0098 [Bacillus badius]|uniref:Uncharacterized protein n=1 Tax=Bacillus badius TaxID=1455 RepID=A0ABR5B040_BACBA|nr:hypothetical protein SD78_3426 [Bacillus badius]KIL80250.1 hypothetical protein SD77_0098 [Bacillus badius]